MAADFEYERAYWAYRVQAEKQAEAVGMTSYFKNAYADFMCAGDLAELKAVAAEFGRYKLHLVRPPAQIEAELAAARRAGRAGKVEQLEKEYRAAMAYQAGGVFDMLAKLRDLYTSLYDELKETTN
jgi:hypothetical protein